MDLSSDRVHTPDELERLSFPGTALAVLGHPIQHSLSPAMHNAALAEMARTHREFATWRYYKFDVHPDDLPRALDRFHARGFHGLNLTVPHKVIAFEHEPAKLIAPAARLVGAVNTLLRKEAPGVWEGYNTDGAGLVAAIRAELGLTLSGMPVILLGAGGAARAAAVECLDPRHRCASLWIANRTRNHLDALLARLQPLDDNGRLHGFTPQSPPADLPAGALVINATSAGLQPGDAPPIDLARLPRPAGVYDMIYNPPETLLLRRAAELDIPRANGLSMLVHQGAHALAIWARARVPDVTVPVAAMERAARAAAHAA
ncbi:MAG: shikimate dehydrogenase [Opitutaceae bacterium]|nr:shikimate dehydrogenase [Opitutaceae bacterium]